MLTNLVRDRNITAGRGCRRAITPMPPPPTSRFTRKSQQPVINSGKVASKAASFRPARTCSELGTGQTKLENESPARLCAQFRG